MYSLSSQQLHDCEASCIAGTVLGISLGVAGPAAGVAAWLAITYSYRRSKHMLVLQVRKQLQLKHISYDKDAHSVSANQPSSSAMVQMTTVTSPLVAKQVPGEQTGMQAYRKPSGDVAELCTCNTRQVCKQIGDPCLLTS